MPGGFLFVDNTDELSETSAILAEDPEDTGLYLEGMFFVALDPVVLLISGSLRTLYIPVLNAAILYISGSLRAGRLIIRSLKTLRLTIKQGWHSPRRDELIKHRKKNRWWRKLLNN